MGGERKKERFTWVAFLAPVALSALVMTLIAVPLLGAKDQEIPSLARQATLVPELLEDVSALEEFSVEEPKALPMPPLGKEPPPAPRRLGFSPPVGAREEGSGAVAGEETTRTGEPKSGESEELNEARSRVRQALGSLGKSIPRIGQFPRNKGRRARKRQADRKEASTQTGAAGAAAR